MLYLDCVGGFTKATCKKIALDYTHSHTHTHMHTHKSACISDGIWISSVAGSDVHFPVLLLYYSYVGCQHWGRVKGAWTSLYISLEPPVNYFIIKSFKSRHDSTVNLHVPVTCFYNYQLLANLVSFGSSTLTSSWYYSEAIPRHHSICIHQHFSKRTFIFINNHNSVNNFCVVGI